MNQSVRLFLVIGTCITFGSKIEFQCPVAHQWNIRASSFCQQNEKYACLWDTIEITYNESCIGPIEESGGRIVLNIHGNLDVEKCPLEYYQPTNINFKTTQGYNCLYSKSLCIEEGQLIHSNGSTTADRTCRCDYTKGYAFISTIRKNPCYCVISEEDCTCYRKECLGGEMLSSDYNCIRRGKYDKQYNCSEITYTERIYKEVTLLVREQLWIDSHCNFCLTCHKSCWSSTTVSGFTTASGLCNVSRLTNALGLTNESGSCNGSTEQMSDLIGISCKETYPKCAFLCDVSSNTVLPAVIGTVLVIIVGFLFVISGKETYPIQFTFLCYETKSGDNKTRYHIISYLLKEVAEPIVRNIFDNKFTPRTLNMTLRQSMRRLEKHGLAENYLLFPKEVEYGVNIMFTDLKFSKEYNDINSTEFLTLKQDIQKTLASLYTGVPVDFTNFSFKHGCVLATFNLKSNDFKENELRDTMMSAVEEGNIKAFKVDQKEFHFRSFGTKYRVDMLLSDTSYANDLEDKDNTQYIQLSEAIEHAVATLFHGKDVHVKITEFQPFNLLASFDLTTTNFYQEETIRDVLKKAVFQQKKLCYTTSSSLFLFKKSNEKGLESSSSNFDLSLMVCLLRELDSPNEELSKIENCKNKIDDCNEELTDIEFKEIYFPLYEQLQTIDRDLCVKTMNSELPGCKEALSKLIQKLLPGDNQLPDLFVVSPLKDVVCIYGKDAIFKCEVSEEKIKRKWYKDDQEIDKKDSKFVMSSVGKVHQLIVKNVQDNDSGEYCICFRDEKYRAQLYVDPFITALKDTTCIVREQVVLDCEVSIDGTVKWLKDSTEIVSDGDSKLISSNGKCHQLTIKDVKFHDNGTYTVQFRKSQCISKLCVLAPFIVVLKDNNCVQHDQVVFDCEVSMDGPVKWFKDNKEIVSDSDSKFITSNGKCHQLMIKNAQLCDSGIYSAHFRKSECSSKLVVLDPFIAALKETICMPFQQVILDCKVSMDGPVKWFKDNTEIVSDGVSKCISSNWKHHQLILKNVQLCDSGTYSAKFRNSECSSMLIVLGKLYIRVKLFKLCTTAMK